MRKQHMFGGHVDVINAVGFSFTLNACLTASSDRTIKHWDIEKGINTTSNTFTSSCFDISISRTENMMASAHYDGAIRLWSTRDSKQIKELKDVHDEQITCVRFTNDGHYCVSTSTDNTVKVWDVRVFKEVKAMEDDNLRVVNPTCRLCISPDDKFCVIGSNDGKVMIFDIQKGELEEYYEDVHTTAVIGCVWQPNGIGFATIDNLGNLFYWE